MPAIFQKHIEQLLQGKEGRGNYIEDIIITGPNIDEHLRRLEKVFKVLNDNNINCKKEKCSFLQDSIEYLGRRISVKGILPDESGTRALKNMAPPQNVKEVEAFMGIILYLTSRPFQLH